MERHQLWFDERGKLARKAVSGSLWLRVGSAATFVLAGGVVALFNGDIAPKPALAMALGGAVVCALALRRAWTVLGGESNPPSHSVDAKTDASRRSSNVVSA
jgi:hypothetical protein